MTLPTEDAKNTAKHEKPNLKGDKLNILLLTVLYSLQGIVGSFSGALPLVMQARGVSYADQAAYSFVGYPGCMKIIWAPIVDCVYSRKFGRRKSWLVPMQYVMGIILLCISINLDNWLETGDGRKSKVHVLTLAFFVCSLSTAIQDVALDAWSVTMLQRRNIGYVGICNNIGIMIGHFVSITLFIALDSEDFCNMFRSVPEDHGFVSMPDFMFFWSVVFLIATTLILIFKKDDSLDAVEDDFECRLSFAESYKHLWKVLKVKPIQIVCLILLTFKMGHAPMNGLASLKLIDVGITQDKFVLLTSSAIPIQGILSVVLSRHIAGPRSMRSSFFIIYILILIVGVVFAFALFFAPHVKSGTGTLPVWYYFLLVMIYNTKDVMKVLLGIAVGAFFVRICDPRFGGIYLTLLNTIGNIGQNWPVTLCLWAVNRLSVKSCIHDQVEATNECYVVFDGFFTETILCTLLGAFWLYWARKKINMLEKLDLSSWIVERNTIPAKEELLLMQ